MAPDEETEHEPPPEAVDVDYGRYLLWGIVGACVLWLVPGLARMLAVGHASLLARILAGAVAVAVVVGVPALMVRRAGRLPPNAARPRSIDGHDNDHRSV